MKLDISLIRLVDRRETYAQRRLRLRRWAEDTSRHELLVAGECEGSIKEPAR